MHHRGADHAVLLGQESKEHIALSRRASSCLWRCIRERCTQATGCPVFGRWCCTAT